MTTAPPILVESWRGPVVESRHRGAVAIVKGNGQLVASVGDVSVMTLMRSVAKPLQALSILLDEADKKFQLTSSELCVIVSSHSGEDIHVEQVSAILKKIGLTENDLHCGTHRPGDWAAEIDTREEHLEVLRNTCSGKHAGMLALALTLGADPKTYEHPDSPVQQRIRTVIARVVGMDSAAMPMAIESCSAPVIGMPLQHIALAYARLINPALLPNSFAGACKKISTAMVSHPELLGGTRDRSCTDIVRICEGKIIAKDGAEGVYALGVVPHSAYPEGLGIALKIENGADRPATTTAIETLVQLDLLDPKQKAALFDWWHQKTQNFKGATVGELRPIFTLHGPANG